MTRAALGYTAATALAALLVGVVGASLGGAAGRAGVWTGAALGFALQVCVFWLFFVWLLPQRKLLAHGLGVMGRFLTVGVVALACVPLLGLPAAPTLFALVGVLFVSTVFEPLFLRSDLLKRR